MKYRNRLLEKRLNDFKESVIEVVKRLHSENEEVKPALVFLVKKEKDFTVEALSFSDLDGPLGSHSDLEREIKKKATELQAVSFSFVCEAKMIKATSMVPTDLEKLLAEEVINISFETFDQEQLLILKKDAELTPVSKAEWTKKGTFDLPFSNVIRENYEPFNMAIQETIKFNFN